MYTPLIPSFPSFRASGGLCFVILGFLRIFSYILTSDKLRVVAFMLHYKGGHTKCRHKQSDYHNIK